MTKGDNLINFFICKKNFKHFCIYNQTKKYYTLCRKQNRFFPICFGLASSPRVFTKVLKPVYAFFCKLGIRGIYYIDDSLNMEQDFDKCKDNTNIMVQKLDDLGI
jgi:hypothetical protein